MTKAQIPQNLGLCKGLTPQASDFNLYRALQPRTKAQFQRARYGALDPPNLINSRFPRMGPETGSLVIQPLQAPDFMRAPASDHCKQG